MIDISVILATYKRSDILFKTLESFCSLETGKFKWEVLIVDNAGDEKTQKVVEKFINMLPIKYLLEKKKGKNNALNKALDVAEGNLYIFTDDDILADPKWLEEILKGSRYWTDYCVFGGRILAKFPSGKIPIPRDHPFFEIAYAVADWNIKEGPYQATNVLGPNMAIRAEVFHKGLRFEPNVGPNGTNYIMGSETEFTVRLENAGLRPVYLPRSLVYHQIRPEQLNMKWIYERAFRFGRQLAWNSKRSDMPQLFGVPRPLMKQLITTAMCRVKWFFHKNNAITLGIRYWQLRGAVYQYRKWVQGK
jgi:glycosyltransferase involved in cell wall biosynthesis